MSLEAAILGFLGERPRSGYDLKTRCFDDDARSFWTADQAQIYRTLERLQSARLVTSKRKPQSGRPDRRIYEITPTGRDFLTSWLAEKTPLPPTRDAFFLQLYFATPATDTELMDRLTLRRAQHQTRLDDLRSQLARPQTNASPTTNPRTVALRNATLDGCIASERATIDWLDDCMEAIRHGHLPALPDLDLDALQTAPGSQVSA